MSAPRNILFLLLAAGAYTAIDLTVLHGPVHRLLERGASPTVANVGRTPISRAQLDRAVMARLWREGKTLETLPPDQQAQARKDALAELIDKELLRQATAAQASQVPVTDAEIDAETQRFALRFPTREELAGAAHAQGLSDHELRARIAASLQQEKFLTQQTETACAVTDAELADYYEKHRSSLFSPERRQARHIFLATLNREPEEAHEKLSKALEDLNTKKSTFEQLAATLSEDERSKSRGGDLGWFTAEHLPADFALPVFSLAANKPTLLRTKIGWHLVEVLAVGKKEPRTLESVREELREALAFQKREAAVTQYLQSLRQSRASEIRIVE